MTTLVFLDSETTHLDPTLGAVWEVSWQVYEHRPAADPTEGQWRRPGQLAPLTPRRTYLVALTHEQLAHADPESLKIGRYTERAVGMPKRTAEWVAARLRADLPPARDVHLVGACPWFDDAMLAPWWGGSVANRPWHYHLVDIETLIAGAVNPPAPPPWKYVDLLARIGVRVDPETAHTAAGDVTVVVNAYATVHRLEVLG